MYKAPLAALAAALVAGAVAAPSPAAAAGSIATFCVHVPDCPAVAEDKGDDLKGALDAASASGAVENVVLVGDKGSPYSGPFFFGKSSPNVSGPSASALPAFVKLRLKAVGPGRPELTAGDGETVFTAANAEIEGIDVRMPNPADGIGLRLNGAIVKDVAVSAPQRTQTGGTGVEVSGNVEIDGLRIRDAGETSLKLSGPGDAAARNLRIDTQHVGVSGRKGTLKISESRVSAGSLGVDFGTGSVFVDHSAVTTTAPGSAGVQVADGSVTLDHATVAHRGQPSGDDTAVRVAVIDGTPSRANIRATALAGYTRGFASNTETGDPIDISVADSVWDPSRDLFIGGAAPVTESNNSHVAPPLAGLSTGDLRPRGGSPMIDRDSKTDGRFRDLDLQPAVDGDADGSVKADAGAFEYRRQAPGFDSANVPSSATVGTPVVFAAVPSDPDGDRTTVAWSFGDGDAGAGAQVSHTYTTPGIRTVSATVTDEAGVATTRTFSVAVGAAPAQPSGGREPGAGQTGGAVGAGGGAQVPGRDVKAPKLASLKLSAKKTRVAKAKGVKVQFTLDEPAKVTIAVKRGKRSGKVVLPAGQGKDKLKLAKALKKLGKLKPGSVSITVTAVDAAGNRSAPKLLKLKLSR